MKINTLKMEVLRYHSNGGHINASVKQNANLKFKTLSGNFPIFHPMFSHDVMNDSLGIFFS